MALWVYGRREQRAGARAAFWERTRAAAPVAFVVLCWLVGAVVLATTRVRP